jgi:hypothetical protein
MATIIDSLVVMLGLDTKDLEQKTAPAVKSLDKIEKSGEKTEKAVTKIGKSSKDAAQGVQNFTRTLTTMLSVIGSTVAIKALISDFIETNAQLDRLSRNLGVSVSTISAWSNASERLGGSAQGLQGTFDMLSKSQTQLLLTGESSLIPYLSALGISLADTAGKARPVTDVLLDLSEKFSHMDRTTANNMGRMMGLDQGTLNLLLSGRKELELEIKRQKESNAVTAAQAQAATRLQIAVVGIRQTFSALGRSLLMEAIPTIEKLLGYFQAFADWAQSHSQFIEDFLKIMAVGLGAIALATLPINLTVAAVVALAAAIALLWDDYQTWKKGGDSLIDWGKWQPGIEAATQSIKVLVSLVQTLWDLFNKFHESNFMDGLREKLGINKLFGVDKSNSDLGAVAAAADARLGLKPHSLNGAAGDPKRAIAAKIAANTGISPDVIYAQMQHETGNFTNRGARDLHNYSGINVPGGSGQDYRSFSSDQEYIDYYSGLLKRKYPGALGAQDAGTFAHGLKEGGYYSDSESNYAAGIGRFMRQSGSSYAQSLHGIPGAAAVAAGAPQGAGSASSGPVDNSKSVSITELNIHTKATDADGIAGDMYHSLDYLLASQANYGLH